MSSTEYTTPTFNNTKLRSFIKSIEKVTHKIKLAGEQVAIFSNQLNRLRTDLNLTNTQIARFAIIGLDLLNNKLSASGKKIKDFSSKFKDAAKSVSESNREIRTIIVDFVKVSIVSAQNQVGDELKLKNNLELKTNANKKQIDGIMKLIARQQNNGVVSSNVQMAGAQQLTNYVDNADSIYKLIPAMNDLFAKQTGITGTAYDAINTAELMGQALSGQTEDLEKAGIKLSDSQKNIFKSGKEQEKVALLAEVIRQKVGGTNRELLKQDAGAIKQATNQYEALKAKIGLMLLPYLAKFAEWFSKNQPMIQDFISKIATVCDKIYASVKKVYEFIKKHPKLTAFIASVLVALLIFIKIASVVKTIALVLALFGIAIEIGPILAFVGAILAAAVAIGLLIANWGDLKKAVSDANKTPLIAKNSKTLGLLSDVNVGSNKKEGDKKKKSKKSGNEKTVEKNEYASSWKDALAYISEAQGYNPDLYKSLTVPSDANSKIGQNKTITFGNINITAKGVTSKEVINEIVPQLKLQLANM